jgi:hydrogen peroxide-dependent heme synthase
MRVQQGLGVVHLFCKPMKEMDRDAVIAAVRKAEAQDCQVVTAAMLGHKADFAFMALCADLKVIRELQTALQGAGLEVVDSHVSITEVNEYAKGMPEHMLAERLYPTLPPAGMESFCFYPMSKRREAHANWYVTPFEERREMMMEHGTSGRAFAGSVIQLVTAATGLDDMEWGVTLFAVDANTIKDVVHTMRFDRGSALYGEFGRFYVGTITPVESLV